MLQDLPEFEVYATGFKSNENSSNLINILYQTNQTNYNEGITSVYDTLFVGIWLLSRFYHYLRTFGMIFVYDMREGIQMSAFEKMFIVVVYL